MTWVLKIVSALVLIMLVMPALAQEGSGEKCSAADIAERVNTLIAGYQAEQAGLTDDAAALESARAFGDAVASLVETCEGLSVDAPIRDQAAVAETGDGTLQSPIAFGQIVDTGEGFSLRVSNFQRRADAVIAEQNMFNEVPGQGEEYVLVFVDVDCHAAVERCTTNFVDYELVGDMGIFYDHPYVVYDTLDVDVVGGTSVSGSLPFMIQSSDTNLRLVYRPNMFQPEYTALAVE